MVLLIFKDKMRWGDNSPMRISSPLPLNQSFLPCYFQESRLKGGFFGRKVPALFVTGEIVEYPIDIYPHEEKGGKILTIKEFLESLSNDFRKGEKNK